MNTPILEDPWRVDADPSKAFFIDMLTRDIAVTDCILDLVDNAIDRAVENSGVQVMDLLERGVLDRQIEGARIEINFSPDRFEISDTCGGIPIDEARRDVFRLGNPDERGASHGLSVYGIGMKRAFFKLGDFIDISSETATEYFKITIDVPEWKGRPHEWWFEFDEFGKLSGPANPGTTIRVPKLRAGIADRFMLPSFDADLRNRIASTYALFLRAGVEIMVNGSGIAPRMPQLVSDPFQPVRKRFGRNDVEILIIASMSPRSDRTAHGWYVFCNGRMVLEADKTSTTGWGEGLPNFHSKFNHFVGLAYFDSADVRKLPWRTTKQGVEKEAPVFQAALNEMKLQARPILDFLNNMYPSELEPEGVEERDLLDRAQVVAVEELPKLETTFSVQRGTTARKTSVSIQYSRPRELVKRIAKYLGEPNMPATRVGEYTFDYFVANELEQ